MALSDIVRHVVSAAYAAGFEPGSSGEPKLWSLGEAFVGDDHYEKLVAWASRDPMQIDRVIYNRVEDTNGDVRFGQGPINRQQGYGLALLALLCEHGRRHARPGEIWPCARELPFDRDAWAQLFTIIGQPTVAFKDAIEAAVRRFHLRNILHLPTRHRWATTIFLQFGVPIADATNLSRWLSAPETAPDALRMLLGQDDDAPQISATLRDAVEALRTAPRKCSKDQLAAKLRASPWFGWSEQMVLAARDAAFAPRPSTAHGDAPASFEQPALDEAAILGQVRYRVAAPLGTPSFEADLPSLPATDGQPPILDLWINGILHARLLRKGDRYEPIDRCAVRSLPAALSWAITLRDRSGTTQHDVQWLGAIDEDTDRVAVYDRATGQRLAGPTNPSKAYLLILGPGIEATSATPLATVPYGEGTAVYVDPPHPQVQVICRGAVVWTLGRGVSPDRSVASSRVATTPGLERLKNETWVRVDASEELDVRDFDTTSVRVHVPESWAAAVVVDGDDSLGHRPQRAARLARTYGFGESLRAIEGRSAAAPNAAGIDLVASLVDRGIVGTLDEGSLLLSEALEWTASHHLIAWPRTGPLQLLRPIPSNHADGGSCLQLPTLAPLRAIVATYGPNHVRLGAWWSPDWSQDLPSDPEGALRAFAAARWMKLPVAAQPHRENFRRLAEARTGEAYRAWVRPETETTIDGLSVPFDASSRWANVARGILHDCNLDRHGIEAADAALDKAPLRQFARVYPALSGVGAEARLRRFLMLEVGPKPLVTLHARPGIPQGFATSTRLMFLGCVTTTHPNTVRKARRDVKKQAAMQLSIDEASVDALAAKGDSWASTRCALASEWFRAYAAIVHLDPLALQR